MILTRDITTLLTAALAQPECDTTRGVLSDAMQERDCWTRETILPWVLKFRENDAPRLLFAQWCEQHGEPDRGEFVRVQCEIEATLDDCQNRNVYPSDCDELYPLQSRERELFDTGTFAGAFLDIFPAWCVGEWARGFPAILTMEASAWLSHADAIVAEHPIEKVRLTTPPEMTSHIASDRRFRVVGGEWTADGKPFAFDNDKQLRAELGRKWQGIEFDSPSAYTFRDRLTPPS